MGAGIAASPHCAERRICLASLNKPRGPFLQSLAHQLRRRFRSTTPSLRRSPVSLPGAPVRRPRFRLESPGLTRRSKPIDFPRPFLGPSPVAVRFAHPSAPKNFRRAALRNWKTVSSGASSRPTRFRSEELPPCLPRRSDLWSPAALSSRFRSSSEAGPAVPITHSLWAGPPSRESNICWCKPVDNGDFVHNMRLAAHQPG